MPLPESPLHVFTQSARKQGQIAIQFEIPWHLPWTINSLRVVLAWEIAAVCEKQQRLVPRKTLDALHTYARWETENRDGLWLDGNLSRNADRILSSITDDLSRIQPRPSVVIFEPESTTDNEGALSELGQHLNITIQSKTKLLSEPATEDTKAAVRLLSSAGLVNSGFIHLIVEAAIRVGDMALVSAIEDFVGKNFDGIRVFGAYKVFTDDTRFVPLFKSIIQTPWPTLLPDWLSLGLPSLLQAIWSNPCECLDRIRHESTQQLKTARNKHHVVIRIARHFLQCFPKEGLAARLDLLEASVELWNKHPERAWQLLYPHANDPKIETDPIITVHIYGQAGQAAAKLDQPVEALLLFEKNLACLDHVFGEGTKHNLKAQADLNHKIGQLLREHPELPGGFARARQHIEKSMQLHKDLHISRGISMCLSEMGELSLKEGEFDESKRWLLEALDFDRDNKNTHGESRLLHQLAILHEHTGDFELGLAYVEQCLHVQEEARISGNLRQQVLNTQERLRDMLCLDSNTESDNPLKLLNSFSSDDPRGFCTRIAQKARTLRQQSRIADAEILLNEALKLQIPEAYRQFLLLGLASLMLDLRRHDDAREILDKIITTSERSKEEVALLMGRLEFQSENYEQAEAMIAIVGVDSSQETLGRYHFLRGGICFRQNQFQEAAVEFCKAREYSRASIYAMRHAMEKEARAYLFAGDYHKAAELSGELAKVSATGKWKLRQIRAVMVLGESLLRLGQAHKAAEEFEHAISLAKESEAPSFFPLVALERRAAQAWASAGNPQVALLHILAAQELLDKEDAPIEQRGWVYLFTAYLQRANGSISQYESAVQIAEQCAHTCGSDLLQHAVAILQHGTWRHDSWSMDDFAWEDDDSPRAAIGQARRLRSRGKFDEALKILLPFEQTPIPATVRQEILELKLAVLINLRKAGREIDLKEPLAEIVAGRSDAELTPKVLLLRASIELMEHRYDSSIETARLAYQKGSNLGEYFTIARAGTILSKALGETGRKTEVILVLQQISDYMKSQGRLQFYFDAKYSLCRHLINMRQLDEARIHLQELINSYKTPLEMFDWVRLQTAQAEISRIEGNYIDAIELLNKVLTRVDTEGRSDLKADVIRLRDTIMLDLDPAKGVISSSSDTDTGNLSELKSDMVLIKSLRQNGHHLDAIKLAEKMLEKEGTSISRTHAMVLHEMAMAYFKGKDIDKAEELCRQSLEMHLELEMHAPGVRVTLATIISTKGNDVEARQQLLDALKENQDKKDNRGIEVCQKRLAQLSGKLPSTGRSLSSKDLFVHAVTLRHKNRHAEAMKLIDQAVELAQIEKDEFTEARARGAIGINAFKEKKYGKAETYLQKAVEMHFNIGSTNLGECRYFLALTYEKLNKPKEALNIIKESMDGVLRDEERLKWESLLLRIEKMKVFTV